MSPEDTRDAQSELENGGPSELSCSLVPASKSHRPDLILDQQPFESQTKPV